MVSKKSNSKITCSLSTDLEFNCAYPKDDHSSEDDRMKISGSFFLYHLTYNCDPDYDDFANFYFNDFANFYSVYYPENVDPISNVQLSNIVQVPNSQEKISDLDQDPNSIRDQDQDQDQDKDKDKDKDQDSNYDYDYDNESTCLSDSECFKYK
ncbi:hypothetical protein M0811_07513 [Anaeramoeba ignava]|uniref:Uncharacterized protein n=1 Tax=Anaeramoeba ignava TaxID=1746090 RepID=A0A9Q0RCH7_ANAIG|nr:hypothetical protein M0811_07513 [Anaeramoeba ignava]